MQGVSGNCWRTPRSTVFVCLGGSYINRVQLCENYAPVVEGNNVLNRRPDAEYGQALPTAYLLYVRKFKHNQWFMNGGQDTGLVSCSNLGGAPNCIL